MARPEPKTLKTTNRETMCVISGFIACSLAAKYFNAIKFMIIWPCVDLCWLQLKTLDYTDTKDNTSIILLWRKFFTKTAVIFGLQIAVLYKTSCFMLVLQKKYPHVFKVSHMYSSPFKHYNITFKDYNSLDSPPRVARFTGHPNVI